MGSTESPRLILQNSFQQWQKIWSAVLLGMGVRYVSGWTPSNWSLIKDEMQYDA